MRAPALAVALKTPGLLVLVLAGVLAIFVSLVPRGSVPVGFDVFWNLHVARTWAEAGFPTVMPEAGFTQLAREYADRQIGFHGLLAVLFGASIDEAVVPPLVWAFAVAQAGVVFVCLRLLRPNASPLWLAVLPALSATWMFRMTALRDMLAGVLPLLVLVSLLAGRPRRGGRWLIGLMAAVFGYVHGAPVLPLVLAVLVSLGWRLEGEGWRLGGLAAVALGLLPSLFLRPDFPHNLELVWTLNVRMPLASLGGDLPIRPSEFAAPSVSWLLQANAPYLLGLAVFLYALARRWIQRPLGIPVLVLGVGALFGARLFELSVPLLVLALGAASWRRGVDSRVLPVVAAAAVLVTLARQIPVARTSVESNRFAALADCGAWLREHTVPGETVFVTDWGTTSPLAWWTRGARLRFTGVTDPSLMWAEDRDAFAAWWRIKSARDPDPIRTMAEVFGARTLVVVIADRAPGRPPGETAGWLYEALEEAEREGWTVLSAHHGPRDARGWMCYRFEPPE